MEVLAISPDQLHTELEVVEALVIKWREAVSKGIPGIDVVTTDDAALVKFITELSGELLLVASKCEALSTIISERSVGG